MDSPFRDNPTPTEREAAILVRDQLVSMVTAFQGIIDHLNMGIDYDLLTNPAWIEKMDEIQMFMKLAGVMVMDQFSTETKQEIVNELGMDK